MNIILLQALFAFLVDKVQLTHSSCAAFGFNVKYLVYAKLVSYSSSLMQLQHNPSHSMDTAEKQPSATL